jgi:dephospho-CoA kinase
MLRVGLTGELGSGKSTVARLLAERGAVVLSSDEMGRAMMQPSEPVYKAIIERFGPTVVQADGTLNRPELARLAFDPQNPRVEELNAIVHPAVLAEQQRRIAELEQEQPDAIVVVESALIFSTKHAGDEAPWRHRFDCLVVVTAPDAIKVERFVRRAAAGRQLGPENVARLRQDAEHRLLSQRAPLPDPESILTLRNDGDLDELIASVEALWQQLLAKNSGHIR